MKKTVLENFATTIGAIGSNVSGDKAYTTWNTSYFSCDCPSGSKLAD
jgi:hypothetical protein